MANLAKRISQGGTAAYSDFWYGPGRERIQQTARKSASVTETTLYVGGAYEKVTRGATVEHVHYIRGGGDVVAIRKQTVGGTTETRYLHRDHLGSVVAASDYLGNVLERYGFDPWGKRRDPSTWLTPAVGTFSFDPAFNDRGYTGHEHIDHLGLVNMNGRVYDPELGRFLSADPFVQFPESTQGYNRYTYVGNNPLSYTDPSGFFSFRDVLRVIGIIVFIIAQNYEGAMRLFLELVAGFLMTGGQGLSFGYSWSGAGPGSWNGGLGSGSGIRPPAGIGTQGCFGIGLPPPFLSLQGQVARDYVRKNVTTLILELFVNSINAVSAGDSSSRTGARGLTRGATHTAAFQRMYFNPEGRGSAATANVSVDASDSRLEKFRALATDVARYVNLSPDDPRVATLKVHIEVDDAEIEAWRRYARDDRVAHTRATKLANGEFLMVVHSDTFTYSDADIRAMLGHEFVHVGQLLARGHQLGDAERIRDEIEAWTWMQRAADVLKLAEYSVYSPQKIEYMLRHYRQECAKTQGCIAQ